MYIKTISLSTSYFVLKLFELICLNIERVSSFGEVEELCHISDKTATLRSFSLKTATKNTTLKLIFIHDKFLLPGIQTN